MFASAWKLFQYSDAPLKRALDAEAATRGATVEVIPCDVCDGNAVAAFAEKRGAEVAALFHCAGVARDGALRTRDAKSLAATADPKTGGALRLAAAVEAARASAGLGPLAVDCAYSSVTALLGNAGQTDYGAANGGLDALAAFRKAQVGGPRCCVSVQWGPWAGHGMASGAKNQGGGSEAAPFAPLLADEALNCLDYALAKSAALDASLAEVAVVRFDFDMLARGAAAAPHLAATCAELGVGAPPKKPKKEKRAAVDAAAEVLRVVAAHTTESGALSAATPLGSLALDSLEVMAIVRDVNTATGARLSVVDVLGAATLGDVAGLCPKLSADDGDSDDDDEESQGDGPDPEAALAALKDAAHSAGVDLRDYEGDVAALRWRDAA